MKEHKKKQFVEMEGSDDEESATRNKSVPVTSIVLPTKRTDSANNQKISRRIVSRDNEDDDAETRRKLSKTDARHLIRTTNKSSRKEDGEQEEEMEDSPKSSKKEGKASPVVIFQYDTGIISQIAFNVLVFMSLYRVLNIWVTVPILSLIQNIYFDLNLFCISYLIALEPVFHCKGCKHNQIVLLSLIHELESSS